MWEGPLRSGGLTPTLQWEKLGSREVLSGQAAPDPGLLTSAKDTFPSVMLLPLATSRDSEGDRQPGSGHVPSGHVASGTVWKLQY